MQVVPKGEPNSVQLVSHDLAGETEAADELVPPRVSAAKQAALTNGNAAGGAPQIARSFLPRRTGASSGANQRFFSVPGRGRRLEKNLSEMLSYGLIPSRHRP